MANRRREHFRKTRKTRMRDLKHSKTGWIGMLCACAAAALFLVLIVYSFLHGGDAGFQVGSAGLIGMVLAVGALILGIFAIREQRVRPVPPRISIILGAVMTAVLGGLYTYGFY
ncbi:MAG: DUF6142 family protein [Clostridiales bacterium]|nr:DUF6142 family protein [Clostridiales bacterium]MCD8109494.1 DUF6142 family protein [Clostridiales bacterium]